MNLIVNKNILFDLDNSSKNYKRLHAGLSASGESMEPIFISHSIINFPAIIRLNLSATGT